MATFSLREFTTKIRQEGLAAPNRFEVKILPPSSLANFTNQSRTISLFCEISNLPGMSITTKGHRIYGSAYQRPVSAEFNGESISMTFYVDRNMNTKAFFDAWMFKIVNPNSFNVAYQSDYVSQIEITQLDRADNTTYNISLEDAFPRAINMMDLNMGSTNQAHQLTVTFAYRRWFPTHGLIESLDLGSSVLFPRMPRGPGDSFGSGDVFE
jgi:hypothetical protein